MKALHDFFFPPIRHGGPLDRTVQQVSSDLEQARAEHRKALKRADEAMQESVRIAQEALRKV